MQSVNEFTPSTTEPVFGSGLISQTKSQSSTNNDTNDNEKVIPSSEPVVNGQNNEATSNKLTSNENITNGTNESINENNVATDLSTGHVNGQNEKPTVEINNEVKPTEEPIVPSAEPEPVETVNEVSSTAVDTVPPVVVEEPTTTTAEVVNDNVPEVPVAAAPETTEVKTKSPRGKAKASAPPVTPTRQSTRSRKPTSYVNLEENESADEAVVTTPSESSSSQRTKRQAATVAKDAIVAASNAENATNDVNEQDVIPVDVSGDNNITEGQTKVSPSPGRKRSAPKSTPATPKKVKGNNSLTPTNDVVVNEPTANEAEVVEPTSTATTTITTPPPAKKARTSATKKTPEPPSEEYARKLRPRK